MYRKREKEKERKRDFVVRQNSPEKGSSPEEGALTTVLLPFLLREINYFKGSFECMRSGSANCIV